MLVNLQRSDALIQIQFFPESQPHVLQSPPPFMHEPENKDAGTFCARRN